MSRINKKSKKSLPSKEISSYVYLFLLVIIPLILNWKNIWYEFTTSDDTLIITNNISFLSDFNNVFKAFEKDNFMSKNGVAYYRPVQTVSFMVDAQMPGEKTYAYHFSNILYHIFTVIVLFFLFRKLGIRHNISFFLSFLFAVHPLFTDAIVWVPGRGDLLAGLFCSASFLSFLYYYSTKNKLFILLHSTLFLIALFSKEISVFLPIVLILYYWFVLKDKYNLRTMVPFVAVWIFSVFTFFLLRHIYLDSVMVLSLKAFISNLPMIPILFSKLIIPLSLSSMPVYNLLFTVIGSALIIFAVIYIRKLKAVNNYLIAFGVAWFLGFIIPAMFVDLPFSKVHFDYLECRAYLPSIGIFMALGGLLNVIISGKEIKILAKSLVPICLVFSVISYIYSEEFADPITYYNSLIKANPENPFAYSERGYIYYSKNKIDLALADFDNSIKISPTYSSPYFRKGLLYISLNDHAKAEYYFSAAIRCDTLYPAMNYPPMDYAYVNLSIEKVNQHQYDEALKLLEKAASIDPSDSRIYNNIGIIYFNKSQYDSAMRAYSKAIEIQPNAALYFCNRGRVKYSLKDYNNSIIDFNKALELKPDDPEAYFYRGTTKLEMGNNEGAISDLSKAIDLYPNFGAACYYRGIAYSKLNKPIDAKENINKALSLGYKQ